jgi:hypothetical protein
MDSLEQYLRRRRRTVLTSTSITSTHAQNLLRRVLFSDRHRSPKARLLEAIEVAKIARKVHMGLSIPEWPMSRIRSLLALSVKRYKEEFTNYQKNQWQLTPDIAEYHDILRDRIAELRKLDKTPSDALEGKGP